MDVLAVQESGAFAGRTRARPSFPKKGAAIDLCRADIIDWLARERTATESNRRGGHTAVDMLSRKEARWHDIEKRLARIAARSVWEKVQIFGTFFRVWHSQRSGCSRR